MTCTRRIMLRVGRILLGAGLLVPMLAFSQDPPPSQADTLAAYERAAIIQAYEHHKVFRNMQVQPRWLSDDSFWYTRQTADGTRWVLVEAGAQRKSPAFDHRRLAAALARATGKEVSAEDLPLQGVEIVPDARLVRFSAFGKHWEFEQRGGKLSELDSPAGSWRVSPDGKWGVFSREHNLWLRDLASGEEKQLTEDGEAFYSYGATPDATGRPAAKPEVVWSPDSRRILAIQTDDRQVSDLPMIEFAPEDGSVRPKAWARRTALPGDQHVTTFRMVSIEVDSGRQVAADHRPVPAVRMNDTPTGGNRAWWNRDGRLAYFVDIDRGERRARVVEFDTATGFTRTLLEESADTYVELGSNVYTPAMIVPLPESNELVWYSERSGWAHLYLYDLRTGQLKRPLTQGDWLVRDVLGVDQDSRQLYITMAGNEEGKDPYYRSVAKVGLDDGVLQVLSASDADHAVLTRGDMALVILEFMGENPETVGALAPGADYFVQTIGTIGQLPRTELRRTDGTMVMVVEEATAHGLPDGWQWPERVSLVAADGRTPISGAVFRPSDFSPERRYPVIDFIYGGPQVSFVPETMADMSAGQAQAMAELGFVVVMIDGRGTTERSREFHEASYGAIHTASNVEDHIAGIRQLGERYPYMDVERVGIYGFSGGGYMTAIAMLRFPEFYKVGVAAAGNYDQRLFWHSWGERYHGMLEDDNYLPQASGTYASQLQGKLLFIHGMMDHGVHPGGLFQLTQALMDENRKFDMLLLPRAAHELPGYAMVRKWDYFIEHLAGRTPPADFSAKSAGEFMKEKMEAANGSAGSEGAGEEESQSSD